MKESGFLKDNDKLLKDLRKIPIFGPFTEDELKILLNMSKIIHYKDGERILKEETIDSLIYFLVYGKVQIMTKGKQVLVMEKRGEILGEMGVVTGARRSASAFAKGPTVCIATDVNYVDKIQGYDKLAFGYVLYRVFSEILAERLRKTTQELMKYKGRSLKFW